jgi:uncharacterized RDD family membrane protein YckC
VSSSGQEAYASLGQRLLAYIADYLLCSAGTLLMYWSLERLFQFLVSGGAITRGSFVLLLALSFVLTSWSYFATLESSRWQATPGKRWLGLVVTDMEGRRISFERASVRLLLKGPSAWLLPVNIILLRRDPQRRMLHDRVIGTLVVARPRPA